MSYAYSLWNISDFIMCNNAELSGLGLTFFSIEIHKWLLGRITVFPLNGGVWSSFV